MGPAAIPIAMGVASIGASAYQAHRQRDAANDAQGQADQAAEDAKKTAAQQKAQAEKLRIETLQQPKKITPDNFMANKARQLAQLRLGMNSTMTGAGNPTLQPAPAALKSKMGA